MDGSQIGVFKERNQVSLGGFLESANSRRLETQIGLEVLSYFTNKALESTGEPSNQTGRLVCRLWHEHTAACGSTIPSTFGNDGFHEGRLFQACICGAS